MSDIALVFDGRTIAADWAIVDNDLAGGDDLKTAIEISLFTERGWWADAYEDVPIGSRLLELRRAKHSQDTLLRARDYCQEALAWLVADGVARTVTVQTSWQPNSVLAIAIEVVQMTGQAERFAWVWDVV